jgi:hypothetical protein
MISRSADDQMSGFVINDVDLGTFDPASARSRTAHWKRKSSTGRWAAMTKILIGYGARWTPRSFWVSLVDQIKC